MSDKHLDAADAIVADIVSPDASLIDRDGTFPRKAISALGETGLLGMTVPSAAGGPGAGLRDAAEVITRISGACGSTGMVVLMHYAATAVIAAHGPAEVLSDIAAGRHLSTLAFSEVGSRSHFWAPVSTATVDGDVVRLDAAKSWVTSAGEADSYVWSSRPTQGGDGMTLWLVPSQTPGVQVAGPFDGLGLRGNASRPVRGDGVAISTAARLGDDGAGLDLALASALPWFLVLNAAFCVGIMRATLAECVTHACATRLEHLGVRLADQPLVRQDLGRMQIDTDRAAAVLDAAVTAVQDGTEDAALRLFEVKAVAAEAALAVTDLAMKVCGGAAFRKELGIERRFRDARAARVMAPTTDRLTDFVGRAICGMPLLDATG